jgi:hypothetical protein
MTNQFRVKKLIADNISVTNGIIPEVTWINADAETYDPYSEYRISVTGPTSTSGPTIQFSTLYPSSYNGKSAWSSKYFDRGDTWTYGLGFWGYEYVVYWSGGYWWIEKYYFEEDFGSIASYSAYISSSDASPAGLIGWTVNVGSGQPVVTDLGLIPDPTITKIGQLAARGYNPFNSDYGWSQQKWYYADTLATWRPMAIRENQAFLNVAQDWSATQTFLSTINANITGNAGKVTNGVYLTGNQTISGIKTFVSSINANITGNAETVTNGLYLTGNQNISGIKTFLTGVNISGDISAANNLYITGNIGIGTSSPAYKLDVKSRASLSYGYGDGALLLGADVNATTRTANTRKVGYIAVPTYASANATSVPFGFDFNSTGDARVYFGSPSTSTTQYAVTDLIFATAPNQSIANTVGGEAMRINGSRNVGIGTASPAYKLDVNGTANFSSNVTALGTLTVTNKLTANGQGTVITGLSSNDVMTKTLVDAVQPFVSNRFANGVLGGITTAIPPLGFGRFDTYVANGWGTDNVPAIFLPFISTKSFSKIIINHQTGTHPTAYIEAGVYNSDTNGLPSTLVEKGQYSLTGLGTKTLTLSSSKNISNLFFVALRPSLGATNFAVSGTGSLTLLGWNGPSNPIVSQLFGLDIANFSQFRGVSLPAYSSYTALPADVTSQVYITSLSQSTMWGCGIY